MEKSAGIEVTPPMMPHCTCCLMEGRKEVRRDKGKRTIDYRQLKGKCTIDYIGNGREKNASFESRDRLAAMWLLLLPIAIALPAVSNTTTGPDSGLC